jgi:hypothetical protein
MHTPRTSPGPHRCERRVTYELWLEDQQAYFYARRLLHLANLMDTALQPGSPSPVR